MEALVRPGRFLRLMIPNECKIHSISHSSRILFESKIRANAPHGLLSDGWTKVYLAEYISSLSSAR
jgi:hypothetical protein